MFLRGIEIQLLNVNTRSGSVPRGAFRSRAPSNHTACAPQTRIVPPKKVTDSVPLECNSRPETPKILVITQNSWASIGVAKGGRGPGPFLIEMLPMIKISQKRLLFLLFQFLLAISRKTVHAYNSN